MTCRNRLLDIYHGSRNLLLLTVVCMDLKNWRRYFCYIKCWLLYNFFFIPSYFPSIIWVNRENLQSRHSNLCSSLKFETLTWWGPKIKIINSSEWRWVIDRSEEAHDLHVARIFPKTVDQNLYISIYIFLWVKWWAWLFKNSNVTYVLIN